MNNNLLTMLDANVRPVAVLKFERGTPGRENDMPRVVSCNWMPDGEYEVYLAAASATQQQAEVRPVTPYTCPKCHALWLHWPAEQTGFGRDTLNCRSADHCHYCEKAGVEQLQRLERIPAALHAPQPSPTAQAAASVPAVEREQERIAFKDAHRHLELYEVPDAWGRPMFKHSHVEASWLGWIARASHGQAPAQADEYPALVCDYCGALTPDPWHSSGMLNGRVSKHIHSCDDCRGAAQAAQGDALDAALLDWLNENIFYREMGEWDAKYGHGDGYNMWVLFAPKGVRGSARTIISAARAAQEGK